MSEVTQTGAILSCSCGAKVKEKKDHKRFLVRHPSVCSQHEKDTQAKKEFTKQLAEGTKSVITSKEENVDLFRLESIESDGRNLTDWEKKFIKDVRVLFDKRGTTAFTTKMKDTLKKIQIDRIPS